MKTKSAFKRATVSQWTLMIIGLSMLGSASAFATLAPCKGWKSKTRTCCDDRMFSVRGGGIAGSLARSSSRLSSTLTPDSNVSGVPPSQPLDVQALVKWTIGYIGQVSLIYATLLGVDQIMSKLSWKLPFWTKFIGFYLFQQTTTFFSLLPRKRTGEQALHQADWEYNKRTQPSWTPPGWVFALMWPLFVFGTRGWTSAMVITSLEQASSTSSIYASMPILCLMAHLCIASLWNTMNNIEKRLGPCVPTLWMLAGTKALTAYVFYQVNPLAGKLLALTLTWLVAAASLETDTWRINPDLATGRKERLYPVKAEKWVTKFRWES